MHTPPPLIRVILRRTNEKPPQNPVLDSAGETCRFARLATGEPCRVFAADEQPCTLSTDTGRLPDWWGFVQWLAV